VGENVDVTIDVYESLKSTYNITDLCTDTRGQVTRVYVESNCEC